MSEPVLVTVEAYGILDLPEEAQRRVLDRERIDAWHTWLQDEVSERLHEAVCSRLDGVADVKVPSWSLLDGGPPSAVVEAAIVDDKAFAASLGLPDYNVGEGLTLDPYHACSSRWAGTTYVLRHDDDGVGRDDVLSEALGEVLGDALDEVAAYAENAESDQSLAEALDEGGWLFDRIGRHLDAVIVDTSEVPVS